jgi:hypothetical protein
MGNDTLIDAWESFRELIYGAEHGFRDWMILKIYGSLHM